MFFEIYCSKVIQFNPSKYTAAIVTGVLLRHSLLWITSGTFILVCCFSVMISKFVFILSPIMAQPWRTTLLGQAGLKVYMGDAIYHEDMPL
jgi:hypothetical protein